jgi:hypothetical protein
MKEAKLMISHTNSLPKITNDHPRRASESVWRRKRGEMVKIFGTIY